MNCIKCGRETQNEQIFCFDCLAEMEKYPVKPGTAVKLPERREPSVFRRNLKRRTVNTDEQIRILKHKVRQLTIVLVLCLTVIAGMLYYIISDTSSAKRKPGQNYNVIHPSAESSFASALVETNPAATAP